MDRQWTTSASRKGGIANRRELKRSDANWLTKELAPIASFLWACRAVVKPRLIGFKFDYSGATRKLPSRYLNLLATDLVAEGIGALFVGGSGLGKTHLVRALV